MGGCNNTYKLNHTHMLKSTRLFALFQFIVVLLLLIAGCKKTNNADEPQADPVPALKAKVVAKWQLVGGSYTEYDANGKVINTSDLSGQNPIPVYDIQANDRFYVTDSREKREFFYTVSVTSEGKSRILIDSVEYYDITVINGTDMIWVRDITATANQIGTARRAYTEVRFKKI
jgi:hypothetical protein